MRRLLWLLPLALLPLALLLTACERHETTWEDVGYVAVFVVGIALIKFADSYRRRK